MVVGAGALALRGVELTGLEKRWHQGAKSSPRTPRGQQQDIAKLITEVHDRRWSNSGQN